MIIVSIYVYIPLFEYSYTASDFIVHENLSLSVEF